jgi:choline dehydrogenase
MLLRRSVTRLGRARAFATLQKKPDYVIVGGGSAGCVLANRLSEDPNVSVLLLEAGNSDRGRLDSWMVQMPAALTYNLADTRYNWDFETTPQPALDGRTISQPRGKVLGGSSSLNAMAYVRGHALDYDRWEAQGAKGWNYAACLPYFKRAECFEEGKGGGDDRYVGKTGPLQVRHGKTQETLPLNQAIVAAGAQAGYPITEDPNGFQQEVPTRTHSTTIIFRNLPTCPTHRVSGPCT